MSDKVLLALAAGVKLDHLRSVARAFGSDWDLIEDRVLPGGPPTLTSTERRAPRRGGDRAREPRIRVRQA